MSGQDETLRRLPTGQWAPVESVLKEFEAAWQAGDRPAVDDYLLRHGTAGPVLLVELIHLDLEYRVRAGEPARVEEYLRRYPQLLGRPDAVLDLIKAEYDFRRGAEPGVTAEEYRARFPHYAADLSARLAPGGVEMPAGGGRVRGPGAEAVHPTPVSLLERLRGPADERTCATAWGRFVELYTPLLFSWALRMGLRDHDAADLVQDVFTLLVRKLPEFTYDRHKSFRAWLRTVTLNKWRENRRRAARSPRADARLDELAQPDSAEAVWEAEYHRHLAARALELMKTDFQPQTWRACWEHVAAGRPAAEVAAELGISVKSVYMAKARVLRRLRRELDGLMD